jgi:hypothetical protein
VFNEKKKFPGFGFPHPGANFLVRYHPQEIPKKEKKKQKQKQKTRNKKPWKCVKRRARCLSFPAPQP